MDSFGERVKLLREQRGLNQAELAPLVGSSRSAISTYENGLTPPVSVVMGCAKLFNVSSDYLLGLSDEARPMATDDLSRKIDRLSILAGKHAISLSNISELIDAIIKYYRSGAKAEHSPVDTLRDILNSMTDLFLFAAGDDVASVLTAVNEVTRHTLSVTGVVNAYLSNAKPEKYT